MRGEVVEELFDRGVDDALALMLQDIADRLHEVGLAKTDTAVDEERVIELTGFLTDTLGCRVGELVRRAGDIVLKGIRWVEQRVLDLFGCCDALGRGLTFLGRLYLYTDEGLGPCPHFKEVGDLVSELAFDIVDDESIGCMIDSIIAFGLYGGKTELLDVTIVIDL
jgi:hypothetical protein